ncbi:MAG: type II toxin-antitoxin system RelE/ParE family toxin [Defluviimonas sp.]|nr:type II toxin-antitoxin system RelE/ParE family toxin [Defluviimonas sp.]
MARTIQKTARSKRSRQPTESIGRTLNPHAARGFAPVTFPPGNHLEALSGDRAGQHSVRINGQWRICFVWTDQGPQDVEIVDYH